MEVQSLSIVVPADCPNDCKFCVAHMHRNNFENRIDNPSSLDRKNYLKRMNFARDNGCNTVVLTGNGEPLENTTFLKNFGEWNKQLEKPFRKIELQTSKNLKKLEEYNLLSEREKNKLNQQYYVD